MQPTQYLTRGVVGILLPVAPPIHRNCFPGIGYVTCPAIENECHPVATLLLVMGICVVLSWLRPQEEMRPWWLLLEELAPGQFPMHMIWTIPDRPHVHDLIACASSVYESIYTSLAEQCSASQPMQRSTAPAAVHCSFDDKH